MEILIILVFIIGYAAIALEHPLKINKAATALLTGVLCWTVFILFSSNREGVAEELIHHLGSHAGILFFLLGAMTIVELIDAHDGFEVITRRITTTDKRKLLWTVGLLTFFLSAALDNLTTAIVMASMTRKLVANRGDRLFFVGLIVIAANAGGAWSPIGDVTTTMLWLGGQVTSGNIIVKLILPSLVCLLIPLTILSLRLKGKALRPVNGDDDARQTCLSFERYLVFFSGILLLMMVPVFKTITHLPPYMGILLALSILWVMTGFLHKKKDTEQKKQLSVEQALRTIDVPSILFFLGILVAVSSLESTGLLARFAQLLDQRIGNQSVIVLCIGVLSAIIDNVPLVAATIGMYDLATFPPNSYLWEFIAYSAGTGGSMLIIGTAAGVAVMGIEKIDFFWYLKRIGWLAGLGYFAGAGVYILQEYLVSG
ncbi:MAG TPA: sodium:proton antiporter NhaD [Pyrinomonadaceae bacterium]|nr:sodium:proton antiporter NhaD [Pyrinomonadaceae bacterium]